MRWSLLCSIALYLAVAGPSVALASKGNVLILVDTMDMQGTHSKFIQMVQSKGYETTIATLDAKTTKLKDWDTWLFDKLIILGGETKLGEGTKPSLIREFFNAGHDVFIALSSSASNQVRDTVQRMGVDVDAKGTAVIDHFDFDKKLGADHTTIVSSALADLPAVFSPSTKGPVIYKGVGLSVAPESEVAFLALTGSSTAYSGEPGKPTPSGVALSGSNLGLVALVQGRNNVRLAVVGSTDMISNAFFSASKGNHPVALDLLQWCFHQRGVLRASALRHRIVGGEENPAIYRINDDVEVEVDIEECTDSGCKPFKANDVQIEFVMLDPHLRTTLTHNDKGTFSTRVKIPDAYGVFKWVLDYRRPGYSWVVLTETVPVRPFRHDEYERFIVQAYPYYASVISMMAGFFVVGVVFLNMK